MKSAADWRICAAITLFCGVTLFPLLSLWSAGPSVEVVVAVTLEKYRYDASLPIDGGTSNTIRGLGQKGVKVLLEAIRQSASSSKQINDNQVWISPQSALVGFRIMGTEAGSAVKPLLTIISSEQSKTHWAFMSLAAIGESGVPAIIKGAGDGKNSQIGAVMALEEGIKWGNIRHDAFKQVIPFLGSMLTSKHNHVLSRAAIALALIGECGVDDLAILKARAQSNDNAIFGPPMAALISIMQEESLPLINEWAGSNVPEKKLCVAQAAWYCMDSELISKRLAPSLKKKLTEVIADGLKDEDAKVRTWAVGHIEQAPGRNEMIIKLIHDPDDRVVEAVLRQVLLSKYRWQDDVEQVSKLSNRKEERVGFLVGKVLEFFKGESQ